jgi:hypothetical protein
MIYILAASIIWGTIAKIYPDGIQPPWVLWLVISVSIVVYVSSIIVIEIINHKRTR